jgi:restriction system protein
MPSFCETLQNVFNTEITKPLIGQQIIWHKSIMARRENSIFEDIADITSKFPWWVGLSLALVSFLVLHSYAGKELPPVTVSGVEGIFKSVFPGLLHVFAFFGQIILPVAFLLGSMASVILNFKRTKLYDKTSLSVSQNSLGNMSWQDFEYLVGEYFRRRQFSVEETKSGADGGVDLIATKGMEKYLIQCKHWKAYKVGVNVVRELLGVMVGVGATGGFVVTSGEYTKDAVDFAKANNILLLDGKELLNSMRSYAISEGQPEKKKVGKLQKIACAFVVILFVAVCYFLLYPESSTSFYSILPSEIRGFLLNGKEYRNTKNAQISTPIKQMEQKDGKFTHDQVTRAMEEVLNEKKSEQLKNIKADQKGEEQKYLYEIDLFSGGQISTDNVTITKEKISFKTDKGLIVFLNREEIKTMKRIKLD